MTGLPPILRFLADVDLDMGPFGLLALTPENCDDAAIAGALSRQLARVARHPHGGAVEADEVRLALHVAAAQLRDPAVREELIEDLEGVRLRRAQAPAAPVNGGPPQRPAPARAGHTSFEHTAMWVIAHSGGWNAEAKRRLWALAHATSVSPSELPDVVARVAQRAAGVAPLRQGEEGGPRARQPARKRELPRVAPLPAEQTPLRKWGPLVLVALLTLSSLVMVRVIAVLRTREIAARTIELESIGGAQSGAAPLAPPPVSVPEPDLASARSTPDPWAPMLPEQPTPPPQSTPASGLDAPTDAPAPRNPEAPFNAALAPWAPLAERILSSTPMRPTAEERLVKAARLALINSAAEQHTAGDEVGAEASRREAESLSPYSARASISAADLEVQLFRMTAPATSDDGRVAMQFQLARRQPGSPTDALNRLRFRQAPLGPADCDVIAEVAFYAPTLELRSLARRFVDDQSNNPFMVYGLLEAASRAPRNQSSSEIIERITLRSLPRPSDPDWPRAARAALVARLFEMLSPDRTGVVDDLAATLTDAYARSVAASDTDALASPDEDDAPDPDPGFGAAAPFVASQGARSPDEPPDADAAGRLFEAWRARAEPFRAAAEGAAQYADILRRRAARLALADGIIQRFASDQAAIVEMAAFVIARERPTRATDVAKLVEDLRTERRQAIHVFEQIEANERALTQLWLIRVGAGQVPGRGAS